MDMNDLLDERVAKSMTYFDRQVFEQTITNYTVASSITSVLSPIMNALINVKNSEDINNVKKSISCINIMYSNIIEKMIMNANELTRKIIEKSPDINTCVDEIDTYNRKISKYIDNPYYTADECLKRPGYVPLRTE